ncbi:MAG: DNA topoisomerase IB [Novosphingobium sp.]
MAVESPESTPFQEAAESAGLRYVSDEQPGISRVRRGPRFSYKMPDGVPVRDAATLERIRQLAIPPAYENVWICLDPGGHLQASGRDAKGRKQYRYHQQFRAVRDSTKYEHIVAFAAALPTVRSTVAEHMALRGLPRDKVLATIIHLLETTMIRVGNSRYAQTNKSYGLSTLQTRHVAVEGAELRFRFKGKSGKQWRLSIHNRRVARIVKAMQELPGQHLFQYLDENGAQHEVTSGDVNRYLKDISGVDITAKDFRTWTGTVLAAVGFAEIGDAGSATAANRNVRTVVGAVASILGNTPTVCRKCYVHPAVVESYVGGTLRLRVKADNRDGISLSPEEGAVLRFLKRSLTEQAAKLAS